MQNFITENTPSGMTSAEFKAIVLAAIDGAKVSRGKNKGLLKAQCPPADSDAAAAWQEIMLEANPYKASIASRIFWSDRQRAIAKAIADAIAGNPMDKLNARGLDRDRVALERVGVW